MMDRATSRGVLRHPLVVTLAIFALAVALCLQTSGLLPNELETLVYAKHWLDPSFIANDWRLDMHPGPRLPFMVVIAPLVAWLPLEQASIIGAILAFLMLACGLGILFTRLGLSALEAIVVVALFFFADQSLAAAEWLFSSFEGKTIAYTLVFCALAAGAGGRLVLAGALLGLATTMHVVVGVWSALCFAVAVLTTSRGDAQQRAFAAGAFVIGALPGVLATLSAQAGSTVPLPPGVTSEYIYVFIRAPHHLDPRGFLGHGPLQEKVEVALALAAGLGFFALPRFLRRSDCRLFVARFVQACLLPAFAGVIASFLPGGEKFLQFYPFRVADTLVPLLGPAVLLALVVPCFPQRPVTVVARVAVAMAAVLLAIRADPRMSAERPPPGFEGAARFIREHAAIGQPVLVSPHLDYAGYWMERPVVALYKFVPHHGSGIAQWYHYMVELAAISPPDSVDRMPRRRPLDAFDRMATEEYLALAARHGARYVVTKPRHEIALPIAFENGRFAVYEVGPQ